MAQVLKKSVQLLDVYIKKLEDLPRGKQVETINTALTVFWCLTEAHRHRYVRVFRELREGVLKVGWGAGDTAFFTMAGDEEAKGYIRELLVGIAAREVSTQELVDAMLKEEGLPSIPVAVIEPIARQKADRDRRAEAEKKTKS